MSYEVRAALAAMVMSTGTQLAVSQESDTAGEHAMPTVIIVASSQRPRKTDSVADRMSGVHPTSAAPAQTRAVTAMTPARTIRSSASPAPVATRSAPKLQAGE